MRRTARAARAGGRVEGWGALGTVLALLACGMPPSASAPPARPVVERAYRPPEGAAPVPAAPLLPLPPRQAIEALAELLGEGGNRPSTGSSEDGTAWLVLTSSGDPEPFVDCGSFELSGEDGAPYRVPAARLAVRLPVAPAERREVLLRQMRLDGRLVVIARPAEPGSRLEAKTSYVVTRTVDRVALDGRVLASERDTTAFETGGTGRLAPGLSCRPTGRLERAVVEAAEQLLSRAGASVDDAPGDE